MTRIDELLAILERLRDPQHGCPWDREQSFRTIAPYTLEEAYEVADAIERDDMPALREELGDLLLQVVFHARIAQEAGHFAFEDVVKSIVDKMIRRHPHVFGEESGEAGGGHREHWERIKAEEKRAAGAVPLPFGRRVPGNLPALRRATKLSQQAARAGFDWRHWREVRAKVDEELAELDALLAAEAPREALEEELGDVLFALANLARHLELDAEAALMRGNAKFCRRYEHLEQALHAAGSSPEEVDAETLERHWREAKRKGL
jgi:nucleoside triphosphate diphosphatase